MADLADTHDRDDAPDEGFEDGPPGKLEGARILIVDDDRDVLEAFDMALSAEGADTVLASDGNAGVAAAEREKPDLVVLDMMLPGRSGLFALERIKGREDSPMVIMVTANEGRRHHQYAEQMGADRYLMKPVPITRLIAAASELLGRG